MKKPGEKRRKKTGIEGLDKTLTMGIPEGHIVLLTGKSGTGKTVLAMQLLFERWREYGDPGLYMAVTEPFTKAIQNIESMDFFDKETLKQGVNFTDIRSMIELIGLDKEKEIDKNDIEEFLDSIKTVVSDTKSKNIVIDSITAIGYLIDDVELLRYFIFRLGVIMGQENVTVFLTSESKDGSTPFGTEDFISDGILELDYEYGEQSVIRKLRVAKMRGVDFQSNSAYFDISSKGLTVYPKTPLNRIFSETSYENRVKTGVPKLDEMVGGGYPEGHIILLTGNTGTGKTTIGMQFIQQGIKENENCLFINLEEPLEQVNKTAESHGWKFNKHAEEGKLIYISPELIDTYPDKFINQVLSKIDQNNINRVFFDSVSALPSSGLSEDELRQLLLQLNSGFKERGVTAILTHLSSGMFSSDSEKIFGSTRASDLRLSSLSDGIIVLRYFERESKVAKAINVLKMRGSDHDKGIYRIMVTDEGIEIGEILEGVV
ncbi:ATPase domain-containing protein [Methanonatronarchaeum sp. AMET-Sl]|uniref:ATPase domain-containing protein n=1 Tax=Methanonatronarchaeum sp. AMET-Sl TaxID=3037654 RepID=UPI00244DEB4C|nr:ATPase domain-containing protein [Methanonatronarchaeum sp. AMET-Sl]WGI17723.1 ATPase domain-containing protein [Methanonatronarchaeum sp. AMET-Sl]